MLHLIQRRDMSASTDHIQKNYGFWKGLMAVASVNLLIFSSTVLLLRPLWIDINSFLTDAIGVDTHWLAIILGLTALFLLLFLAGAVPARDADPWRRPSLISRILVIPVLVVWNGVYLLLLTELGEDFRILTGQFAGYLPWGLLLAAAVLIVFVLPGIPSLGNMKAKTAILIALVAVAVFIGGDFRSFEIIGGPYLQNPGETTMTVRWISNRQSRGHVEYGESETTEHRAFSSRNGLVETGPVHKVVLTGLKPGTTYRYRVVSREIEDFYPYNVNFGDIVATREFIFKTPDRQKRSLSFLVFNDIHENVETLRHLMKFNENNPYDYVFFNGDSISHLDDETQIHEALIKPSTSLFASEKPFFLIRGNHETRGAFARHLPRYVGSTENGFYGSFQDANVYFIILDSGEDKEDDHVEYSGLANFEVYRTQQAKWLEKAIEGEAFLKAVFRIALIHMPVFLPGNKQKGVADAERKWGHLLNRGNVDLLIGGHTHESAVIPPREGKNSFPILIGGGSRPGNRTMIRVTVDETRLKASIIRDDGTVVGTYEGNGSSR